MLRKFFIIAFLFIVGITPAFAFDSTTCSIETSKGECDYVANGMRCGGTCGANARCVFDSSQSPNPHVCGNGTNVFVGKCVDVADYPCNQNCNFPVNSGECGSTPCGSCLSTKPGFRCMGLAAVGTNYVGTCYVNDGNCISTLTSAPAHVTTVGHWVVDQTCSTQSQGCQTDSNCASGEQCYTVNEYTNGSITGSKNICSSTTGCTLPSGASMVCSKASGCAVNEYCVERYGIIPGTVCADVETTSSYPSVCFSDGGDTCGTGVFNAQAELFPLVNYCKTGQSCLNISTYTFSANPASYPTSGVCAKCVTTQCTGEIQPNTNGLDDCCDPDKRCSANGQCQDITAFQSCAAPNSGSIKPGTICKYKDQTEDRCSTCPVTNSSGDSSYTNTTDGNDYCVAITSGIPASTCTNDCGCNTGSVCDNGTCKAAGSCIQKNQTCVVGGPTPCCNATSTPAYSCIFNTSLYAYKCESPECNLVKTTGNCTDELESCCPAATPFCNDGVCGEAFECTSAGECCPGFGEVCTEDLQCAPAADGECIGDDNTLPPAPGYLGPKIEIPQLFSSIGAILYPAGIGIGLFFIVRAGYVIMMSEGNPDEVKRGQEQLTSAIIGTLFIVLSTAILRVIINTLLG